MQPTDVTDEDCSICLETPVAGDVIRRLPCMHAFHQPVCDYASAMCHTCLLLVFVPSEVFIFSGD